MAKRVVIDTDSCLGCGMCETALPQVFKLDEKTGVSSVIMPEGGPEAEIEKAIVHCLASCISWEED
jgi:ferredoxin